MIQSRYYQDEADQSIFDYYASGKTGNPVVAMPTASGKGVVIAKFMQRVLQRWHQQRFLVATHVRELVEQNYKKMREVWPEVPAGIHSAGLNKRDSIYPIIFGNVQTMVNNVADFGWRDLLLIDEAHLVSGKDDSNYGKLIAGLKAVNPNLKTIGFTATRWRMGNGYITDGPIFSDCCYDLCTLDGYNKLISEGFLCTLIPKRTSIELDTSEVKIIAGEFQQNQLQAACDKDKITYAACKEIIEHGSNRNSWLIFASGITHAEHIATMMQSFGIDAVAVHSKMTADRDKVIKDFKSGRLRCIVNNNVLTTGFDHPGLDMIGMLRPTASTALWVQMLGRGTRPEKMKENCLVLDFAGNTKRLGPINDPVIPKKRGERVGTPPVKICECGAYNHTRATHCIACGLEFPIRPQITMTADNKELIAQRGDGMPIIELVKVDNVIYSRFQKQNSTPILKISYRCNVRQFDELVCLEHSGYALKKAHDWWSMRMAGSAPKSVDEALSVIKQLPVPRELRVWTGPDKKYPEVMSAIF